MQVGGLGRGCALGPYAADHTSPAGGMHCWLFWPIWYGPVYVGHEHCTMPEVPVRVHGAVMQPAYGDAVVQFVCPKPSVDTQSKLNVEIKSAPGIRRR